MEMFEKVARSQGSTVENNEASEDKTEEKKDASSCILCWR